MIITNLIGGLGNQMFQYAAGLALAEALGTELYLDLSCFADYALRKYLLNHFDIEERIANGEQLAPFRRGSTGLFIRNLCVRPEKRAFLFLEKGFPYQALRVPPKGVVLLKGYWQSEKYFANIGEKIRHHFRLKQAPNEKNAELLERIGSALSVSMHVRRGDYVQNPVTQAYHGTCSPLYYRQAMQQMKDWLGSPYFFLFSDDPAWCQREFEKEFKAGNMELIQHNSAEEPQEDLRLMSACRHAIIANSSLSWWGAWLAEKPGQRVIAPKQWFSQESKVDFRDLVPERWSRL